MSLRIELLAQRLSQRTVREIDLPAREQAAVAVILSLGEGNETLELLLIRRSERVDDPWSGHMALPGGRREPQDADLCATAVRETREEIGVELFPARLLGRLDDIRPIRQSEQVLAVRPFVFWSTRRPELELGDEVAAALWVALPTLKASGGEARVQHRGAQLRVPAFLLEQRVVWGMTQRVLAGLLELAQA